MQTISEQIHYRVTLITAIINKEQAVNRIVYDDAQYHAAFNRLYVLHNDDLKKFLS